MTAEEDLLPLSGIQHFAFCPRQWALIHIECQWKENERTAEGRFLHERADDPFLSEKRRDRAVMRSVPLVSLELGIRGVADVVEFTACGDPALGIRLPRRKGLWAPNPVEYKLGSPKCDERDIVQLCAQAMCLEEMHAIAIASGDMYYGKTRHRLEVPFDGALRDRVRSLCREMLKTFQSGVTPPPLSRGCKLCSLMDLCVPQIAGKGAVSRYYDDYLKEAGAREEAVP